MTTTGVVAEKKDEKVEKRKALGRGLAALLPGPRMVPGGGTTRERNDMPPGLKPAASKVEATAEAAAASLDEGLVVHSGQNEVPRFARDDKGERDDNAVRAGARRDDLAGGGLAPGDLAPGGLAAAAVSDPGLTGGPGAGEIEAKRAGAPTLQESQRHEALEPEVVAIQAAVTPNMVEAIDLSLIDPNPYQTRYLFDKELLQELADSIKTNGVVQPIMVRPGADGRYVLVLGERRVRASKLAGKATIPAMVKRLSLQQAAEMTVLENIQRQDLNAVEQAEAFRVLSLEFKLTQAQIAQRIGVSRETISNYMRLLRLPEEVMQYMLDGQLSFSDAREILSLDNDEHIPILAAEVVEKHLRWDELEERVRELNGFVAMQKAEGAETRAAARRSARWMDPNVRAAQTEMERTLGMRVRIKDRNGKGKITIEYASVDDYQRVMEMLRGKRVN